MRRKKRNAGTPTQAYPERSLDRSRPMSATKPDPAPAPGRAMPETTRLDSALCREAVHQRRAALDGSFVYAIPGSTVYCRPSCTARRPRPDGLRFYPDPDQAEAAGLHPCRRCAPHQAPRPDPTTLTLIDLSRHLQDHADVSLTLQDLAGWSGLSPGHLQRRFKALFGVTPRQFQAGARLRRLKSRLRAGASITDAMHDAGYGSASRLHAQADGRLGMTPSAYRAGGAGEIIHHACRDTALGPLMMAATTRGVCFVQFGEDRSGLLEQLTAEFPRAELRASGAQDSSALDAWISALDAYLSQHGERPELPLDLRGTAFQLKVWEFLIRSREGEVLSYTELARGIGSPKAVRAAASACAANRIAVLVPCHRVLRGDGGLGGYRWGLPRKRLLIDAEHRRSRS